MRSQGPVGPGWSAQKRSCTVSLRTVAGLPYAARMGLLLLVEACLVLYAGIWLGMKWKAAPALGGVLGFIAATVFMGMAMFRLRDINAAILGQ